MTDNYIVASAERQAQLEAAKAAFFMRGGQVCVGPGIPERPAPAPRSTRIDPETVLVRKRRRLRPAEAETVRRMTEAI